MSRFLKRITILLVFLIVLVIVLPNVINEDERLHYSDEERLKNAKERYDAEHIDKTVVVAPAQYYAQRSSFHQTLFGTKYRDLWNTPVQVPVFTKGDSVKFECIEMGGGEQTISADLKDSKGRVWTLRSIDKDQSRALHPWIQKTVARPIVRDEVAAMNPFGAFVAAKLTEAVGLMHTHPKLVFVPYLKEMREGCALNMAGRLAMIEEELGKGGWVEEYRDVEKFIDTDDMFDLLEQNDQLAIDTQMFVRARLLDILIADWDRHEGQWVWAQKGQTFHPIPVDRDMTFYLFDDGWLNRVVLLFNKKFRSFHEDYHDISGFTYNSKLVDSKILSNIDEAVFIDQAEIIQRMLGNDVLENAMRAYPEEIFQKVGEKHIAILQQRLSKLKKAARDFHAALND